MSQDRLTDLTNLSIESKRASNVDFEDIIRNLATQRVAKSKFN